MKNERDPSRVYNSKVEFIEKTKDIPLPRAGLTLVHPINYNRKLPTLSLDSVITIKKDEDLLLRAGGYNSGKIYSDLQRYAKLGLYDE
jgi:hypothetical protein